MNIGVFTAMKMTEAHDTIQLSFEKNALNFKLLIGRHCIFFIDSF